MSYVFQEYPKWVRADGARSRIVANEDEERAFYESLPPLAETPVPPEPAAHTPAPAPAVQDPPPKRRGRPPNAKVAK